METDFNHINELLFRLLDNEIGDEDFAELIDWLNSGREAKLYYYRFMGDYSALSLRKMTTITEKADPADSGLDLNLWAAFAECEKSAPAVEIPKEEVEEEAEPVIHPLKKKPISKFQIFTVVMSAAAMLCFALFIKLVPEPLPSVEVATLVDQMNVQWADPGVDLESGCRLVTNNFPLGLKKGLLSIAYDQGVEVVVEGPAKFEVERSGIFLEYGRVYSRVSETGTGFTVNTSTSQFVDLGTEFGVRARVDGSSEVHVTKGKVQMFAGAEGKTKTSRTITEKQAVRFNAISGLVKNIPIRRTAFVRKIDSALEQIWTGPSAYERAVQKTKPLHYWRFDWDRDGVLRNEMDSALNDEYKLFGSLGYSDGPALSKDKNVSLRLTGREEDYAILRDCTEEADNADGFTISMWIRPEKADSSFRKNVIMRFKMLDDEGIGGRRSLGFDDKNRFYFNVLSNEDAVQKEGVERISIHSNPVAVNTWHHVVVSYTKNDRVNLYVDGELQATQEILSSLEPANKNSQWCLGSAAVASEYRQSHTSFAGSLDEICHYNRELSTDEVGMLYEAVGQK